MEEPNKSKKSTSSAQIPESTQNIPVKEEEEKKNVEIVKSEVQAKPEGSNPGEGTRSNPDGVSALITEESNPDSAKS